KTAYDIFTDWSSDVCSSDLGPAWHAAVEQRRSRIGSTTLRKTARSMSISMGSPPGPVRASEPPASGPPVLPASLGDGSRSRASRSEEHTSELQSREKLVCRL